MPAYVCALRVCVCVCEGENERACVSVCCCCRRAAAAAAAAWPFGNFIDTDTTQSVGNCCIQRFVRSPTELKFEFAPTHFGSHTKLVRFVRSLARLCRCRVFRRSAVHRPRCLCVRVCVCACAGYRAAAVAAASSSASSSASFNVIVINSITSFRFGLSFSQRVRVCICDLHLSGYSKLASRTCVLVASLLPTHRTRTVGVYLQTKCVREIYSQIPTSSRNPPSKCV